MMGCCRFVGSPVRRLALETRHATLRIQTSLMPQFAALGQQFGCLLRYLCLRISQKTFCRFEGNPIDEVVFECSRL